MPAVFLKDVYMDTKTKQTAGTNNITAEKYANKKAERKRRREQLYYEIVHGNEPG